MNAPIDSIRIHFSSGSLFWLNICLGYIMFGIALQLKRTDFIHLFKFPKAAMAGVVSQYVVFPAVTLLLIQLLRPHPGFALGMILIACCPSGNISNFITHLAKGNTALSISLTALSTVLSPFLMPLMFALLGNLNSGTAHLMKAIHIPLYDMLTTLAMLLFLPLAAGFCVQYFFPRFALSTKKFFHISSLVLFAGFIAAAVAGNFSNLKTYVYMVAGIVFLQDTLGFFSGYVLARLLALPEPDCRSISIETGIHNSGLGLILIFSFFQGLSAMALIAAWWGIWHLISGIAVASYWNYRKVKPEPATS
jgi:BASS family bile acid:Na+ symporter